MRDERPAGMEGSSKVCVTPLGSASSEIIISQVIWSAFLKSNHQLVALLEGAKSAAERRESRWEKLIRSTVGCDNRLGSRPVKSMNHRE